MNDPTAGPRLKPNPAVISMYVMYLISSSLNTVVIIE